MRLEDVDEDILVQGSTYNPKGEVDSGSEASDDDDEDLLDGTGSGQPKKKITEGGPSMKVIIIIAGIIITVLIAVIGAFAIKKNNDKHAEELLAMLEAEEEPDFMYSPDEIETLRTNGYTGKEIEQFELDGIPASRKVEEAELARKALYDAEIEPYLDGASDKFNELLEYTWLYGPDLTYDVNQADTTWYRKNMTLNLDYDKVPAKGIQCFVRLTLKQRTDENEPIYMFMMIDPIRYSEIPQSGNIVVYVEYFVTDQGTIITKLEEKRVADK